MSNNEKFYYQINVIGKHGYSCGVVTDEDFCQEMDFDVILDISIANNGLEAEEREYVSCIEPLTIEEYEDLFGSVEK